MEALLPSQPWLAMRLLSTAPDAALGEMFADGRLVRKVDAAIPRADLERFYGERFGATAEEVAAGAARPREVYPAGFFRPGMLSPDLADLPVTAEVTPERARAALHGRGEAEIARALAGLSPPEAARAAWWIVQARESVGWQRQALAYLTGDWAVRLTARQQRELVVALVTGRPSPNEVWLALQLLRAAHDDDLRFIVDSGGELLAMLEEAIPADHSLREELESFLRHRFGGRDELAAGRWVPRGQPAGLFSPALLHDSVSGVVPDVEPSGAELDLIEAAISRLSTRKLTAMLMRLPLVERARAARWLTTVRVALHARGTTRPEVMATIDNTLDVLYRAAASDVPGPDRLSLVTRTPQAEEIEPLGRVLDPAPGAAAGQALPFTNRLDGQDKDFGDRLAEAYDSDLEFYTKRHVDNRREADRVAGNLDSLEDMWAILADAQKRIDKTFGHLRLVKGWDGIRIHDQWEYADQRIKSMTDTQRRDLARQELLRYLTRPSRVSDIVWEHRAVPRFGQAGQPPNDEADIISAVIEGLLDKEGNIARVLDIYRGWPGGALSATKEIWFQVFRPREPGQAQRERLVKKAFSIHELLHLTEHPRHIAYRESLGPQANNTLGEGSVTLFTEIVWPGVRARGVPPEQAGEREQLRVGVITDAPRQELGRVLAGPGSSVLAVWTAEGRDLGTEEYAPLPGDDARPLMLSGPGLTESLGVSEPVAEALARYGRAEKVLSDADAALSGFQGRTDGPADTSATEQERLRAVSEAELELADARHELEGLEVAEPEAMWQEALGHLARRPGARLPGGARRQAKRAEAEAEAGASRSPVGGPRLSAGDVSAVAGRVAAGDVVPGQWYRELARAIGDAGWDVALPPGATVESAAEGLAAVLALARVLGGEVAELPRGDGWNRAVAEGLRVLGGRWVAGGYARALPGVNGDALIVGAVFAVAGPVAGYASEHAGSVFVIDGAPAMDVTGLPGVPAGVVVFAPGSRFRVNGTAGADRRRTVTLRIPAEPVQEAAAAGPPIARWRTMVRQLSTPWSRPPGRGVTSLVALLGDAGISINDGDLLREQLRWLAGVRVDADSGLARLLGVAPITVTAWLSDERIPRLRVDAGHSAVRAVVTGWQEAVAAGRRERLADLLRPVMGHESWSVSGAEPVLREQFEWLVHRDGPKAMEWLTSQLGISPDTYRKWRPGKEGQPRRRQGGDEGGTELSQAREGSPEAGPAAPLSPRGAADGDAMEVDEERDSGGVSQFAPEWARPGEDGFFELAEPERVRELADLRISREQVREQLERTAQRHAKTAWQVRNLPGGGAAATAAEGVRQPGGVGFLVTVPVPYRPSPGGYDKEYRSAAELVEMYVRAAGQRAPSGLRMVIAINRLNDPRRSGVRWKDRLPYGTTAKLEDELAAAVAYWQAMVDEIAPGIATVIGQMVEPSVWDGDRLVDADVLRHLMMQEPIKYWRRFPYAGVRQATVGSPAALARLRELWRLNDEVWIHLGDSDIIDATNPAGGNTLSLLGRYAAEIRGSAAEGPSPLVRLGGGYAFSPQELEYGPRQGPAEGEAEQLGDAARLTLLLAEADNLQRDIMSRGRWPRGYFTEQNTLLNSRYVEQLVGAMGQDVANPLDMPDLFLGLHARLGQLGLLSDEHSRFLSDPAARVLTSAHGHKTTIHPDDMRDVLSPRTDDGQIAGFDILRPGRTLSQFGMLATHGITRKDRNMTFRPMQFLRVGKALGLPREKSLFDPDARPQELAKWLARLRRARTGAAADRQRAQLLDTGPKAAAAAQLAARMEQILERRWAEPLDAQLAALWEYADEPLPDWYVAELLEEINQTDAELATALSQLRLDGETEAETEPTPASPTVDDLAEILQQFTRLTIDPAPAAPDAPEVARSPAELAVLADHPDLAQAPPLVRRMQLPNELARRRFQEQSQRRLVRYQRYRARLVGSSRQIQVSATGDGFFEAALLMAGDHLAAWGREHRPEWGGQAPSVAQMRASIAGARIEGDDVVAIAAHLWQLPLTALTPEAPVDYGPSFSTAPRGYLLYDGSHYTGVTRDLDDPALPASGLLALPPEPELEIPPELDRPELAAQFAIAFGDLHGRAASAADLVVGDGQFDLHATLADLLIDFDDAQRAAAADPDGEALEEQIRRMSELYHNLAEALREARASARSEATRPQGVSSESADGGQQPDEVADAAVAFPAEPVTQVGSREFAAAVDELAAELYGDQPPPPLLAEVIGYLVEQRWMPEVPDAEELRALAVDVTGVPVEDVGPPQLERALNELAREAAAARDRGDAVSAALGEIDAGSVDSAWEKVWGKLGNNPARAEAVGRAVTQAQQLIGRPEPVVEVRTQTPTAELAPLGQAIRRLALHIYHNPDDVTGAEALAESLAAELDRVLPKPSPGRRG